MWRLALREAVGTACGGPPLPSQLSWSPDSRQVLTASGDKSCKIFDIETCQVVT